MIWQNMLQALSALRQHKLRSFLTILGIVIGVGSVVTVIAVGNGVKQEISNQVSGFGTNLVQITPGKTISTDEQGNVTGFNPVASFGVSTLTEKDVSIVASTSNVEAATPVMIISGVPTAGGSSAESSFIVATNPELTDVTTEKVAEGRFFGQQDSTKHVAVLGANVADTLFPNQNPIGKTLQIRNLEFEVVGLMAERPSTGLNFGFDFGDMIYIPLGTGKKINNGVVNIIEIDAKVDAPQNVESVIADINSRLTKAHGGAEDFTVLSQEDALTLVDNILGLMTSFVAAIAAISLFVGGIGIMNIMLVAVTERTREIGVRKAIGANNRHILGQFLIESIVLSLLGGLVGVLFAIGQSLLIKSLADISPVFSAGALLLAVGISTAVGIIFGIAPAIKAARKNPVEALRYE